MSTDWRLVEFIKVMRETYGNVGKEMIKPFLDEYANELGLKPLSQTTIAKVIKRRRLTFEAPVRVKRKNKFAKLRVRKHPKVNKPGYIQMDSVIVYVDYEKHVFMCVIDIFTKFAVVEKVFSTASIHAREVFKKFQGKTPTPIHTVQTDNGSEFMKYFHSYLEEQELKHVFIYPKSPKINGVVERFNRTVQQEFISRHDEIYYDEQALRIKLDKYLYWYNYKRPHAALGYLSPMTFIQTKIPISG
jgi:transposase InsO family protein